jgi:hypothetical protein
MGETKDVKKKNNGNKIWQVRERNIDDWIEVSAKNAKEAATEYIEDKYDEAIKDGDVDEDGWTVEVRRDDAAVTEIYTVTAEIEEITYRAKKVVEDED